MASEATDQINEDEIIIKNGKTYRRKKYLPPVADLLAFGASDKEPSWWDILWGPLVLVTLFFLSLRVFLYAYPQFLTPRHQFPPGIPRTPGMHQSISPDPQPFEKKTAFNEEPLGQIQEDEF